MGWTHAVLCLESRVVIHSYVMNSIYIRVYIYIMCIYIYICTIFIICVDRVSFVEESMGFFENLRNN